MGRIVWAALVAALLSLAGMITSTVGGFRHDGWTLAVGGSWILTGGVFAVLSLRERA